MSTSSSPQMTSQSWMMLLLLSLLWGGSFFFIGVAVHELPPLTIVAIRVALAAVALWGIVYAMGHRMPSSLPVWGAFLGMGLLNNVLPFSLIVWGQTEVASGLASILNASTPIFAIIVAGLILPDEKPTLLKWMGVLVGFIGVVVMIGVPAASGGADLLHQLAIVGAAICYAFAGVYGRRFAMLQVKPVVIAAGQVSASALVLLPVTWLVEGPVELSAVSYSTWLAMVTLAIASTAFAYVLYFRILEQSGATNVLLVTLLVPVSAIVLGALFLDERLAPIHFIGMAIIALGLSFIDGRLWRLKRR